MVIMVQMMCYMLGDKASPILEVNVSKKCDIMFYF